eukprot:17051_1
MIILLIAFSSLCTLLHADYTGCGSAAVDEEFVIDRIYACTGKIESGGVYGSDAEALCGLNYHVCKSALEVEGLGLTKDKCKEFPGVNEFFATQETSDGSLRCYSHNGGDPSEIGSIYNDFWGCARDDGVYQFNTNDDCGVLPGWVGQGNIQGWIYQGDHEQEAVETKLIDTNSGGVLCCQNCAAYSTKPHECECQSTCTGRFCHTSAEIKYFVGGQGDVGGYCPDGEECCCSCPDCHGFKPWPQ